MAQAKPDDARIETKGVEKVSGARLLPALSCSHCAYELLGRQDREAHLSDPASSSCIYLIEATTLPITKKQNTGSCSKMGQCPVPSQCTRPPHHSFMTLWTSYLKNLHPPNHSMALPLPNMKAKGGDPEGLVAPPDFWLLSISHHLHTKGN